MRTENSKTFRNSGLDRADVVVQRERVVDAADRDPLEEAVGEDQPDRDDEQDEPVQRGRPEEQGALEPPAPGPGALVRRVEPPRGATRP